MPLRKYNDAVNLPTAYLGIFIAYVLILSQHVILYFIIARSFAYPTATLCNLQLYLLTYFSERPPSHRCTKILEYHTMHMIIYCHDLTTSMD